MEISVIIPVYNKEQYLRQCLESVLEQEFGSFEVVVVNDGSTDASGRMCAEAAQSDARVRVIHAENGGVTAARRKGLELSRGRYVMFLDADDRLLPGALQATHSAITSSGADEVIATYVDQHGHQYSSGRSGWADTDSLLADLLGTRNTFCVLWGILFRRDLLDGCLGMPRLLNEREDIMTQIQVLMKHPKVYFITDCIYRYTACLPNTRQTTIDTIRLHDHLLRQALKPEWPRWEGLYQLNQIKFYECLLVKRQYATFSLHYKALRRHLHPAVPLADRIIIMLPPRLARLVVVAYKWLRSHLKS